MKQRHEGNETTAARVQQLQDGAAICIKTARIKLGLRQKQVADTMGWPESVQAHLEQGQRQFLWGEVIAVLEGMGADVDNLIREIRQYKPPKKKKKGKKPR
jgi:transcriptional regulator with XRE-family HTH domain